MTRPPKIYLVCYDICDDKRLRRVYKAMRGYGEHMQYSVFRCLLSERQLAELQGILTDLIHHQEDQVLFVPLGSPTSSPASQMWSLGLPVAPLTRTAIIL